MISPNLYLCDNMLSSIFQLHQVSIQGLKREAWMGPKRTIKLHIMSEMTHKMHIHGAVLDTCHAYWISNDCRQEFIVHEELAYHKVPRIDNKTCPACTPQQAGFPGWLCLPRECASCTLIAQGTWGMLGEECHSGLASSRRATMLCIQKL